MGALINANDHFGHSPLHYAAYKGNAGLLIICSETVVTPMHSKHCQPLHRREEKPKVAEILLEDGADGTRNG